MMLCRLLLMRHAKSSPQDGKISDHERPLNEKGTNDAPQMALKIRKLGYEPKLVLCSDSRRTLATWELMAPFFDPPPPLHSSARLYESTPKAYLEEISKERFAADTMLLIGHNPVAEDLVRLLTTEIVPVKPANIAILEIHADSWKEGVTQFGVWKLVNVISC